MTIGKEEVLRSTNSVMNLYTKLAQLEKEGKRGTKEYCDIFSLLEWSIRSEKNKYKNTSFSDKDKETYLKKLLLKKAINILYILLLII